jgi:hypothetical protein
MPDITMCSGDGCPLKDECFRYTATPSPRQSYFVKAPFKKENGKVMCDHFWESDMELKHPSYRQWKKANENTDI